MYNIAGIVQLTDTPVSKTDVKIIIDSFPSADNLDFSCWTDGVCALAQISTGKRVEKDYFSQQKSNFIITENARIDNRDELCSELNNNKADKTSNIILNTYKKWGDKCLRHLSGDFTFAIWDGSNKSLFCARDHMGIKPFFYYKNNTRFVFSSQLPPLLKLHDSPNEINDIRVCDYLQGFVSNDEYTFYKDIHRLEPRSSLLISRINNRLTKNRYSIKPKKKHSYVASKSELKNLLTKAVSKRLDKSLLNGCQLSGGLDSSSITCITRKLLPTETPLHTYSAVYKNVPDDIIDKIDESKFQESVVSTADFKHTAIDLSSANFFKEIQFSLEINGQPFFYPNLYVNVEILKQAKKDNIGTLLTGFGGDTTISYGYEYLCQHFISGKWLSLFREISSLSSKINVNRKTIIKALIINLTIKPIFIQILIKARLYRRKNLIRNFITRKFSNKNKLIYRLINSHEKKPIIKARSYHLGVIKSACHANAMEIYMAHSSYYGIETSSPFYDKDVIEYCLSVNPKNKLTNGFTRSLLRDAMENIIPEKIRKRTDKANIGLAIRRAKRTDNILNLCESLSVIHPYLEDKIDYNMIYQLADKLKNQLKGNSSPIDNDVFMSVYRISVLNSWLYKNNFLI